MFVRDRDLRSGGGAQRDARARVLEQAKEQRDARTQQRRQEQAAHALQRFARDWMAVRRLRRQCRADFDAKVADIETLKTVLAMPKMAMPPDVLFSLLRALLFVFSGLVDDQQRLRTWCGLCEASLATPGWDGCLRDLTPARRWALLRLVDVGLQSSLVALPSVLTTLRTLVRACPSVSEHLRSTELRAFSRRRLQYAQMDAVSLPRLVRRVLVESSFASAQRAVTGPVELLHSAFAGPLIELALFAVNDQRHLQAEFVAQVLSVPLLTAVVGPVHFALLGEETTWPALLDATLSSPAELPLSPVDGIQSCVWLLANALSVIALPQEVTDEVLVMELSLLTRLIWLVPLETYFPKGAAVGWTQVSESHSVPIVFPEELTRQLHMLFAESRLRFICRRLLSFAPSRLSRPLVSQLPTPMNPTAPSIAEQFGFAELDSPSSSSLWHRVKLSWTSRLFSKMGRREGREPTSNDRAQKRDTRQDTPQRAGPQTAQSARASKAGPAFRPDNVFAVTRLFAAFLCRWGNSASAQSMSDAFSTKILNVLSFLKIPTTDCESDAVSYAHSVKFFWCVVQEIQDFEAIMQRVDLLRAKPSDGFMTSLAMFCITYSHLLLVLDDEEMYEAQLPLPLCQVERVIVGMKSALFNVYWLQGDVDATETTSIQFGKFVVDACARLMRDLYRRCSRIPFCNVTSWVSPLVNATQLIDEAIAGTPRANKLVATAPFLVAFPTRVKLFQRLVQFDRAAHQGEGGNAYRVRIRRNAVFADGLAKLSASADLKSRIHVVFVNAAGREEIGIDAGGLFKEFWVDLAGLAFDPNYGLFLPTADQLLYPNPNSAVAPCPREADHLALFEFVGRVLGKALYEDIVVQPKFAQFFLSKLLHSFNHLSELPSLDPEIYKNLMFLKSYEGDVEDLGLTHTVVRDMFGEQREVELLPGGASIPVTNKNRTRYIHLVANYYLNTQIREQSAAFRAGLARLIDVRWLQMFNEPELQVLISGKGGEIDVADLRAHTKYAGGYYALDKRVIWFWKALEGFTPAERAAVLRFATSCQRAPSLGFSTLTPPFTLQKISIRHDHEQLPSASTCFNTLKLPTYSSFKVLRSKLLVAITSGAGFELS